MNNILKRIVEIHSFSGKYSRKNFWIAILVCWLVAFLMLYILPFLDNLYLLLILIIYIFLFCIVTPVIKRRRFLGREIDGLFMTVFILVSIVGFGFIYILFYGLKGDEIESRVE